MTLELCISIGFLVLINKVAAKKCTASKLKNDPFVSALVNDVHPIDYVCPRQGDPDDNTECCWDDGICCSQTHVNQIDGWLLKIVSICVMTTCLCLAFVLLTCCFWSKCPFYNTCRANYTSSDAVMFSLADEEDPLRLMPKEDIAGGRYIPCKVKMRIVDDV